MRLAAAIAKVKADPEAEEYYAPNGYQFSRLVFYRGKWIRHGDWYPDRLVRLFRRADGGFAGGHVHEKLELAGEHPILPGHLHHFTYEDAADRNTRSEHYARLWVQTARERKRRAFAWSAPTHAAARFIKGYFLKGGFLDGEIGRDIAEGNAREVWMKYDLLWKLNREHHS